MATKINITAELVEAEDVLIAAQVEHAEMVRGMERNAYGMAVNASDREALRAHDSEVVIPAIHAWGVQIKAIYSLPEYEGQSALIADRLERRMNRREARALAALVR